ncbi:hypothetical protein HDV02_005206 [Globomyces sp. JEL0801]|nr:hypothetical protein HDV02_005206 [Globomyces sp. JEL0801]
MWLSKSSSPLPKIPLLLLSLDTIKTLQPIPIHNPIVDQILSTLSPAKNADEIEKQQRMYQMIRYSKKYKKIQVENANSFWNDTLDIEMDEISTSTKTDMSDLLLVAKHVNFKEIVVLYNPIEFLIESKLTLFMRKYFSFWFNKHATRLPYHKYYAGLSTRSIPTEVTVSTMFTSNF